MMFLLVVLLLCCDLLSILLDGYNVAVHAVLVFVRYFLMISHSLYVVRHSNLYSTL